MWTEKSEKNDNRKKFVGWNFKNFKGNPLKILKNARSTINFMAMSDLRPYFHHLIWGPNFSIAQIPENLTYLVHL